MILCKCGAQCQDNTKFCPKCGAALTPTTFQSNGTTANPQGANPYGTYNNVQGNNVNNNPQGYAQNNPYANPQGNYQNAPYTNPQGNYQNNPYANPQNGYAIGMPMMGQNTMKAKRKPNIIGMIGGILLAVSMFLPYITASFMGESMSEALIKGGKEAYLFIALGIGAIILSILGVDIGVLITGIIASMLTIYEVIDFSKELSKFDFGNLVHRGVGFYVMIAASVIIVIAMPIHKLMTKNK